MSAELPDEDRKKLEATARKLCLNTHKSDAPCLKCKDTLTVLLSVYRIGRHTLSEGDQRIAELNQGFDAFADLIRSNAVHALEALGEAHGYDVTKLDVDGAKAVSRALEVLKPEPDTAHEKELDYQRSRVHRRDQTIIASSAETKAARAVLHSLRVQLETALKANSPEFKQRTPTEAGSAYTAALALRWMRDLDYKPEGECFAQGLCPIHDGRNETMVWGGQG